MLGALHNTPHPWLLIVFALTLAQPQLAAAQNDDVSEQGDDAVDETQGGEADDETAEDGGERRETSAGESEPPRPQALDQAAQDTADGRVFLGSRARRHTAPFTPVPVTVLTADDLRGFHGPSLLAPVSLRGLGPDRVLVLVNGKRRHQMAQLELDQVVGRGTSGTDLNAIPIAAIERVEILRDSAAALYGPNAVSGVINIVLKERRGFEAEVTGGNYYDHDGNALLGLDRVSAGVNGGFDLGEDGFVNLTLEVRDRGETNRAGIAHVGSSDTGEIRTLGDGTWWQADPSCPPDEFAPDVIPPCKRVRRLRIGNSNGQDYYGFYNGAYDLSKNVTLYSFGGFSRRIGDAGTGLYLGEGNGRTPAELYPDGYLPNLRTTVDDLSVTAGARFALDGPWELDASATYGQSRFDYYVSNTANLSYFYQPIDPNDPALNTPRYFQTPTEAFAGQLVNTELTANLDLRTQFDVFESLNLAGGLEVRRDNYQVVEGETVSWDYARGGVIDRDNPIRNPSSRPLPADVTGGTQGFPGFHPDNAIDDSRLAWGAYLQVDQQLTERWLLDLSGRFESVQFTGENVVGRLATRFGLTDSLALRASASNGSRSPDVQKIYFSKTITAVLPPGLTETITVGDAHPLRDDFGIGQLKPEKSLSTSAGIVFSPKPSGRTQSLTLTLDAFVIRMSDRILLSDSVIGQAPADPPGLLDTPGRMTFRDILEANNLGAAQFFVNAADTITQGLDVTAGWGLGFGDGLGMHLSGAFNYSETRIQDSNPDSTLVNEFDLFSPVAQTRMEKGEPRYLATLAHATMFHPLIFRVAANYYGAVSGRYLMSIGEEKEWGSKVLTDASLSYLPIANLMVTVGANNAFDVYPDKWGDAGNEYPEVGYVYGIETLPFGLNGGFYYLGAKYSM